MSLSRWAPLLGLLMHACTKTPASAPIPQTLATYDFIWGGPTVTCTGYQANWFNVPGPGTLHVTARWTPAHYDFDLVVNTKPEHQVAGSNSSRRDGGMASVDVSVPAARAYDYEMRYVSGCPDRATATVVVVFIPSP